MRLTHGPVFVRPGERRSAEWPEIDVHTATWRILATKMKMRADPVVPPCRQALAAFRDMAPLACRGRHVFPSERTRDRPANKNSSNGALRRLSYAKNEMCAHGFRTLTSTLLNEQGWPRDVIERRLAHAERNEVRPASNGAEHLTERCKMMQARADYLDGLGKRGDLVSIREAKH